jgi:hypothetical protein
MTSVSEYASINDKSSSELGKVTLRQGLKYKKYQNRIASKVEKKNLLFEGFQGMQGNLDEGPVSSSDSNSGSALAKTKELMSITDNTVTSQVAQLRDLQTKFNTLLQQYNNTNSSLMGATKEYVTADSLNVLDTKDLASRKKLINVYANTVANDVKSEYLGCYADSDSRALTGTSSVSGQYVTYEQCKQSAIDGAFKYFGLQNKQSNDTGWCSVGNDKTAAEQYGISLNDNARLLWSTGTQGSNFHASVNADGRLLVSDSNGVVQWESPNPPAECSFGGSINVDSISATYGGNCHAGTGNVSSQAKDTINQSGFQWWKSSTAVLPISNQTFGDPTPGCAKSFDVSYLCGTDNKSIHFDFGEGRNAVLNCTPEFNACKFYLVLQSDGNLVLYKNGMTPPAFPVWATATNGQYKPNPDWVATKGKYGYSYLSNNQWLDAEEWVGSDDGSLKLVMQSDGNLALYTSDPQPNCTAGTDGNMYGGGWANSLYELNKVGFPNVLRKVGYVDEDSKLAEYPTSMYTFDTHTGMPIINNNKSCIKTVKPVDTIDWNSYMQTGVPMSDKTVCGLEKATQNERIDRENAKMQLVAIADEIVNKILYLQSLNTNMNDQMGIDKAVLADNLKTYQEYSQKYNIKLKDTSNINGILSDSDIVVLQENYSYLFWSILAIAIVVITINTIKR